jgi:Rrf2 family protein
MVDMALQSPTTRSIVSEIAKRQDIPASFLAKIVPRLARAGLVRTALGAGGGITLAAPPAEISLLQIIQAIDGPLALNRCSLDPTNCRRHATCPACEVWRQAQTRLNETLEGTRLSDLVARAQKNKSTKLH